ncbi:MAG: hypothetical protein ACR2NU_06260 [Aeoliella sp.]
MQRKSSLGRLAWLVVLITLAPSCLAAEDVPSPPAASPADNSEEAPADGEEPVEMQTVFAQDKRLRITLPAAWKRVEPRNKLIEIEFAISPADVEGREEEVANDDERVLGRMTMMASGGGVERNVRRWIGQFRLGQDADGKDAMHREEIEIDRAVAHTLDIAGTFFDSPKGPFGPKVEMPNYRMLGAIIEVEEAGDYFIKFYGPDNLVAEHAEAFQQMVATLEVVDVSDAEAQTDDVVEANESSSPS